MTCSHCDRKHYARGYCGKHWYQVKTFGRVRRTQYDPQEIVDCGEYAEIVLYNRLGDEVARTKIDRDDVEKVRSKKWHKLPNGYVASSKTLYLHVFVSDIRTSRRGPWVDHIDGDKLNNRKANLRAVTPSQSQMNKRGKKGYSAHKNGGFYARLEKDGKVYRKYCRTEEQAKQARKRFEQELFGAFAPVSEAV